MVTQPEIVSERKTRRAHDLVNDGLISPHHARPECNRLLPEPGILTTRKRKRLVERKPQATRRLSKEPHRRHHVIGRKHVDNFTLFNGGIRGRVPLNAPEWH